MAAIVEKEGFKLASIVLSKEEPFSFKDLSDDLKRFGIVKSERGLKKSLENLKENGVIIQCGSLYLNQR